MSTRSARVLAQSIGSAPLERSSSYVETIVSRVLGTLECGELALETSGGSRIVLQGHRAGPQARLTIHSWRLFARLAFGGDIGFAEAYIAGEWSSPNLVALLNHWTWICATTSASLDRMSALSLQFAPAAPR